MEFIGGIFWLLWMVGLFFIKKNANQKNRQKRFEQSKQTKQKKKSQVTHPVSSEHSQVEQQKAREAMLIRNQKTQQSARLKQEATKKRNLGAQQTKRASIKDFVETVQKSQQAQQSKAQLSDYLSEEYEEYEELTDAYVENSMDAYSLASDDDGDIDWANYESDLFDDSDWDNGEDILLEVDRRNFEGKHTSTNGRITLNASNLKEGIILSEILAKPKSQR